MSLPRPPSPPAFALLVLALGCCLACGRQQPPTEGAGPRAAGVDGEVAAVARPEPFFDDLGGEVGLDFVHFNGMSGGLYYSEMMGSGAALFDADGDGDLDLYLVQGAMLGDAAIEDATFPPRPRDLPLRDRLLRNDLQIGPGGEPQVRFVDVTEASGIDVRGYGMGVAAADFDGDGRTDLYVTQAGANRLLRNLGDLRFEDVTDGVTGIRRWSVPAAVLDFDGDGWLDLYVGNYVDYSVAVDKACTDELGQRNYCGPLAYAPVPDNLLRNLGPGADGRPRFEDWSGRAGIVGAYGACLGATAADFDGDGRMDVYVANDGTPNQLWINQGPAADGRVTFRDQALLAGAGVNGQGHSEASMGVAVADFDGDGDEDVFLTHLTRETHTLYVNDGTAHFLDRSAESGLGAPSFDRTGFGTGWLDLDNDGHLDLLAVAGAVKVIKAQALAGEPYPLRQPDQLYRNLGDGRFEDVSPRLGPLYDRPEVGRGAAFGDVDNDGDTDVVVVNNSGPARLLLNRLGQDRPWLGLRLVDGAGRIAHGARAELWHAGRRLASQRVNVTASYASSNDPRLLFGLGDRATDVEAGMEVRVLWPDGRREVFAQVPVGRYTEIRRGTGEPPKDAP